MSTQKKVQPYQSSVSIDTSRVLVKHLPPNFTATDKLEFFQLFGAIDTKLIGRTTAIAQFAANTDTKSIVNLLHQRPVNGHILHAEFAKTTAAARAETLSTPSTTETTNPSEASFEQATAKLQQYLQALSSHHDFGRPPPPHLRYCYPKLNRDIMDAICIALETTPKFYTQVLHLMNRMNLEPPFVPGSKNLQFPMVTCEAATQTDADSQYPAHPITDLASDESELSDSPIVQPMIAVAKKRKAGEDRPQLNKRNRMRSMLHSEKSRVKIAAETSKREDRLSIAFEDSAPVVERSITILAPDTIAEQNLQAFLPPSAIATNQDHQHDEMSPEIPSVSIETCISNEELQSNRIPLKQLSLHPLFVNYKSGEPSNKLYIKNLSKNVEENDLLRIYRRYHKSVDVKLMRTGRMKGQAFITFNNAIMEEMDLAVMAKALNETNGFILKDKAMVVMYGKKSSV